MALDKGFTEAATPGDGSIFHGLGLLEKKNIQKDVW